MSYAPLISLNSPTELRAASGMWAGSEVMAEEGEEKGLFAMEETLPEPEGAEGDGHEGHEHR
jgi:hypothetical protein